jgi:hypothetical protein
MSPFRKVLKEARKLQRKNEKNAIASAFHEMFGRKKIKSPTILSKDLRYPQ